MPGWLGSGGFAGTIVFGDAVYGEGGRVGAAFAGVGFVAVEADEFAGFDARGGAGEGEGPGVALAELKTVGGGEDAAFDVVVVVDDDDGDDDGGGDDGSCSYASADDFAFTGADGERLGSQGGVEGEEATGKCERRDEPGAKGLVHGFSRDGKCEWLR